MYYNIFLDDIRNAPQNGGYRVVRTYDACISMLSVFGEILNKISLDYDLCDDKYTGYDVLVYMHKYDIYPKYINMHSYHPVGTKKMLCYAKKHFPESIVCNVTTNE